MNQYLLNFVNTTFLFPGKSLDLGAGQFLDVAGLKQLGWQAEGVDLLTNVDLENPYLSQNAFFDLVYANYILHKIQNHKQFIKNMAANLKEGGYIFIHTFDISDQFTKNGVNPKKLESLLKNEGFEFIQTKIFPYYDDESGHQHWHQILQVTAKKKRASA